MILPGGEEKKSARKAAMARRITLAETIEDAADRFTRLFHRSIAVGKDDVVSGYSAIGSELDVMPLLESLSARGVPCCLPSVVGRRQPLIFRPWVPGTPMRTGAFNVQEPDTEATVRPSVLIVPLLAFDPMGYRLGYGAGFYDATIAKLRGDGPVLAVGSAFAGQEVTDVPREPHDERLDWIITEAYARRIDPHATREE